MRTFRSNPVAVKEHGMQGALDLMLQRKPGHSLLALALLMLVGLTLGAVAVLNGGAAFAQNIDQGKPATRLFADSCATCHHNARGLAKGRFRLTLFLFLQQHYSANSSSAWELTSYLESVDTPKRGRSRATAAKSSPRTSGTSRSSLRPPMPVPNH